MTLPVRKCASIPTDPYKKLKMGRESSSCEGLKKTVRGWMKHKTVAMFPRIEWVEVRHSPTSIQMIVTEAIVSNQVIDMAVWWTMNQISLPKTCFPVQSFCIYRATKTPMHVAPIHENIIKLPWTSTKACDVRLSSVRIMIGLSSSKRIASLERPGLVPWYPIDSSDVVGPLTNSR